MGREIWNERIRSRRKECGLTLLEVANKIGVKEATVQRYESGNIKNIKRDTLVRLAEALDTTPAALMGWDSENESEKSPSGAEAVFENQLALHGYRLVSKGSGGSVTLRSSLGDVEVTQAALDALRHDTESYFVYNLEKLIRRSRAENAGPHLVPIAAHNDNDSPEQQALMQEDLEEL